MRKIIFALTLLMVSGPLCLGGTAATRPLQFQSTRGLARGNANITTADGLDAFYYNPAAFNLYPPSPNFEFTALGPQITVNDTVKEFAVNPKGIKDLGKDEAALVRDHLNDALYARVQNLSGGRSAHFAFAMFTLTSVDVEFFMEPQDLLPSIYGEAILANGVMLAYYQSYLNDRLLVGVKAKVYSKEDKIFTLTAENALDVAIGNTKFNKDNYLRTEQGTGMGSDLGVIWRSYYGSSESRVGVVVENLGKTHYRGKLAPSPEPQIINVGSSIVKKINKREGIFSFDFADVGDVTHVHAVRRMHMGFSWYQHKGVAFYVGLNQGYGTLGLHLGYRGFFIDLARYGEELGSLPGFHRDQRSSVNIGLGWVF